MKLKRKTKAQLAAEELFKQKVLLVVRAMYGERAKPDTGIYALIVDTHVGPLRVDVKEGVIFCRFVDVTRAAASTAANFNHLNESSGKWNWHWGRDYTKLPPGDDDVLSFAEALRSIEGWS